MGRERAVPAGWGLPAVVAVLAAVIIGGPLVFYGLHLTHRPEVHPIGHDGQALPGGGIGGASGGPAPLVSPFPAPPTSSGSASPTASVSHRPTPSAAASATVRPPASDPPEQRPTQEPTRPPARRGIDVHVAFNVNPAAYTVSVRIFNNTSTPVSGWTLSYSTSPGQILAASEVVVRDGGPGTVLLTNSFNNATIGVGDSATFYYSLSGQPLTSVSRCIFNTAACTIEVVKVVHS